MCLQVMSRGRVVNAGTSESVYFSLSPDQSWTPLACILVYYTLPDGEIVNDALQVTFTQVLTNTVRAQIITFMTSCVLWHINSIVYILLKKHLLYTHF